MGAEGGRESCNPVKEGSEATVKRALKWVWRVFLGYCVVLAVMRGLFAWPYARSAGDWVRYLASMTEDSTLYSEGYEKAFRSLCAGMSAGTGGLGVFEHAR